METVEALTARSGVDLGVWGPLATLLERLPAALDQQLQRDSGLTHFEFGVLYALERAPQRELRLSVLAGYSNATLSRLSRGVTRLEDRGWLRREVDPDDGRYTLAALTDSGSATVREALPGHLALVEHLVFGALTKSQVRTLGQACERINARASDSPPWTASS
ncbi:MarR family winged helix-turn-helix transcriptional regulator [Brachybacterium sp.]|uniref:MarR family winged helix-turn-helix transcriptional regulator n=1 Tax=Brachybacterium sp. TaxID=1891286 RepID=UPI002ED23454